MTDWSRLKATFAMDGVNYVVVVYEGALQKERKEFGSNRNSAIQFARQKESQGADVSVFEKSSNVKVMKGAW